MTNDEKLSELRLFKEETGLTATQISKALGVSKPSWNGWMYQANPIPDLIIELVQLIRSGHAPYPGDLGNIDTKTALRDLKDLYALTYSQLSNALGESESKLENYANGQRNLPLRRFCVFMGKLRKQFGYVVQAGEL